LKYCTLSPRVDESENKQLGKCKITDVRNVADEPAAESGLVYRDSWFMVGVFMG